MALQFTNYAAGLVWSYLLTDPEGLYLGLLVADPTPSVLPNTEMSGGGYLRQPMSFADPAGDSVTTALQAIFSGLNGDDVWGLGVWDDDVAGNLLLISDFDTPIEVEVDGQLIVPAGDAAFRL